MGPQLRAGPNKQFLGSLAQLTQARLPPRPTTLNPSSEPDSSLRAPTSPLRPPTNSLIPPYSVCLSPPPRSPPSPIDTPPPDYQATGHPNLDSLNQGSYCPSAPSLRPPPSAPTLTPSPNRDSQSLAICPRIPHP
ncbi:hypothetical protein Salat_0726800 [Sesamum alatum]|uniref:Uncharacterized protein n=1 Tax=Sesamum alatum TaxID=300844 RepID=A0AAE2CV56_9LAMI|nr:hypothetical protein Salat_0726800 [Sesamum alatum]